MTKLPFFLIRSRCDVRRTLRDMHFGINNLPKKQRKCLKVPNVHLNYKHHDKTFQMISYKCIWSELTKKKYYNQAISGTRSKLG